jgi:hypothetical protein
MKKNILNILLVCIVVTFITFGIIFSTNTKRRDESSFVATPIVPPSTSSSSKISVPIQVGLPSTKSNPSSDLPVTVTLIAGKSYAVSVSTNTTVYHAMEKLASTTSFEFNAKYYAGLGYFIQEINGQENNNGRYWTLYVNDVFSPVGASQYILENNDKVEWKFEKK